MKDLKSRIADREQRAEDAKKAEEAKNATAAGGEEEEEASYADWTVAELKSELDTRGVEYDSSAKKADLVAALDANDAEG